MKRLRELDFLRGVAIILVLLRHEQLFGFTTNMGWIGVDLFFVLSGFLVSGLLFKEYLQFNTIKPGQFLIRRGFKIYPIYYIFYLPYVLYLFFQTKNINVNSVFCDLTFIQNYALGWGYAYTASWSLAVEEHFYIGFSILLWIGLRYKKIKLKASEDKHFSQFEIIIIGVLIFCLLLRCWSNFFFPEQTGRNFTMSHLRIDSLLAGVLISYYYYFKRNWFKTAFDSNKKLLIAIAIIGIAWTPLRDPVSSFFAKTIGFTFLYISFGILLCYFILQKNINNELDRIFSKVVVNGVSKIGFCSYSIYIIHTLINSLTEDIFEYYSIHLTNPVTFIFTSMISITVGMGMTYTIERYFLNIRNKRYPSRISMN